MRRLITPLIGGGLFIYGLMVLSDSITWIVDTSDVMLAFVVMMMGALLLSVELSKW